MFIASDFPRDDEAVALVSGWLKGHIVEREPTEGAHSPDEFVQEVRDRILRADVVVALIGRQDDDPNNWLGMMIQTAQDAQKQIVAVRAPGYRVLPKELVFPPYPIKLLDFEQRLLLNALKS